MSSLKQIALATGLGLIAAAGAMPVAAQSTDGFHAIQLVPIAVDTASFTQRFTFKNPDAANAVAMTIAYYPANGTTQAAPIGCPTFTIPAGGQTVFTSLRSLCPALAAGSQFGYVYAYNTANSDNTTVRLFSLNTRVSNPAGNGFSVEGFPAHTFTSADSIVTGLRRIAASGSSPAFQTNCFVGSVGDLSLGLNSASTITYTLFSSTGATLGTGSMVLTPGKMERLLDVFAAAQVPAGNQDDAYIVFRENDFGEPGLMTFCTVQDNTSYGADFRIGKQLQGFGTQYSGLGAQDDHVSRNTQPSMDIRAAGETAGRTFSIPASVTGNTHVMYFRHPDWVQCEIIDPATNLRATAAYGLELRLVDQYTSALAGGAGIQGFNKIYLGDKTDRNNGTNARYTIEVESTAANTTAIRPYRLHCQSGSGHTLGDIIKYNVPAQF